jgi:hypothetical protein
VKSTNFGAQCGLNPETLRAFLRSSTAVVTRLDLYQFLIWHTHSPTQEFGTHRLNKADQKRQHILLSANLNSVNYNMNYNFYMKSQQQPPIGEQPAMFTVSTMGANVTVKRKRSHVEPGLPTEPRKINLKSKRKLEMSKNMRLDQFFTKKPKSKVNNEAEIEKNFEYEF